MNERTLLSKVCLVLALMIRSKISRTFWHLKSSLKVEDTAVQLLSPQGTKPTLGFILLFALTKLSTTFMHYLICRLIHELVLVNMNDIKTFGHFLCNV